LALKAGDRSPRRVDPIAAQLVEQIMSTVDWVRECDAAAVWAWARVEARCQLLGEYLMDNGGDVSDDPSVQRASDKLIRLEGRAESLRSKLGLDPLSRAKLGRDVAASTVDLASILADGAQIASRRLAALDATEVPDEGDEP
jgi:phage terminase small subunit